MSVLLVEPDQTAPRNAALGELYVKRESVNPARYLDEKFALFSVPAYERHTPDMVLGRDIGSSKVAVEPGDTLLCRIVPHIRRAWVVPGGEGQRQIASGEWIVLRGSEVDPGYLRHVLLDDSFHINFMSTVAGVGGSLMRARPAQAADIRIPLPPLPEQRRIAAILDQADKLRTQRRLALALLDELVASLFVSVIGDEGEWRRLRLGELLEVPLRNGVSPSATGQFKGTVLTLSAITRGVFAPEARKDAMFDKPLDPSKSVREGELLFCRGNGNKSLVGRGEVVGGSLSDVAFPDTMIAARVNAALVDTSYLREIWHQPSTRRQIDAGARTTNGTYKVNQLTLESVTIPMPPLVKQKEFSEKARRRPVAYLHASDSSCALRR